MTSEKKLQNKIIKYLRSEGAYVVKIINSSRNGVPDIIACFRGKFIGIEVKGDKNTPTLLQNINLRNINSSGGYAISVNNFNDLQGFFEKEKLLNDEKGHF